MSRHLWLVVAMLIIILFFHYSAQERVLFSGSSLRLSRHALERILFMLPITYAAFMFGVTGGLLTLLISLCIMLPRIFLVSPYPADALVETITIALVGGSTCWLVAIRDRERQLRQEALERLAAVCAVSDVLIQSLELDQILDGALDKMVEVLGVERRGGIFLVDDKAGQLLLVAHRGLSPEFVQAEERIKVGECLCGRAAQTGEVIVSEECRDDLRHCRIGFLGEHSHVIVPLRAHDRIVGVLFLYPAGGYRWSSLDVDVLTTIGNQVGVAVENALLHQDVGRQLARERRLSEVAQKITSELELAKVLPTVAEIAEELIDADAGVTALLDEEKGIITYPYLHNLPQELTKVTMPRGQGLAGEVMTSGSPMVVEDYRTYHGAAEAFLRAGVVSVAAAPIVSGEKVFGALIVVSLGERKGFSERDLALITGVGRQAGIAIENARLYDNLRFYVRQITRAQEDERKRMARELHDDTAQSLALLSRQLDASTTFYEGLSEPVLQRLDKLRELTGSTLQSVRRFSQDLRPPALDDLGLMPALEGLKMELSKRGGTEVRLEVAGQPRRLSAEMELLLFRIAQEALRNIEKHAQASVAVVSVGFEDARVRITISDNGKGFHLPEMPGKLAQAGKLGLIGMQERAQLLGGSLTVQSEPGEGTTVMIDVPA